jgi:hypothetical protein
MKVLYVQVLLEKNEHFSTPVYIYPWELPVFAAAHRNSGITELGERVFEKKIAPRADVEYERLGNRYKSPEGTDMTYVSAVYGHGTAGVRKLQEAMVEAVKRTQIVAAAELAAPTPKVPVQAIEFASPFGEVENIPDSELGIETQADLRRMVSGESEPTVESVAS